MTDSEINEARAVIFDEIIRLNHPRCIGLTCELCKDLRQHTTTMAAYVFKLTGVVRKGYDGF